MIDKLAPFRTKAIWAYDLRRQSERTPEAIAATCQQYGITALQLEVYYGLTWQGQIDGLGPVGLAALSDWQRRLTAGGVTLIPVFVPRGLPGEAQAHGAVAAHLGAGVIDMEWQIGDDSYWSAPGAAMEVYYRELREAAPDAALALQPDSRIADTGREMEWRYIVEAAAPYMDAYAPQVYSGWPAYGTSVASIQKDAFRAERFATMGPLAPTLYTSEEQSAPARLWNIIQGMSIGVCAFRLGAMDVIALKNYAAYPLPVAPEPPPPDPVPPVVDWEARFWQFSNEVLEWQNHDEAGARMRRDRIYELTSGVK